MAALPEPWKSLRARLESISERVRKLENAASNKFSGTGLSVPSDGVTQVDGDLVVKDGEVRSSNYVAGVSGWRLRPDGTIEVNDAEIRGGIIGNDALTNPSKSEAIYASTTNFSLTTTLTNKLTKTLTVPAGFTSAAITVTARVFIFNPNTTGGYDGAGGEYLYGQANIAGFNGWALPLAISGNSGSGTNISTFSAVLTGLTPGGSVLVQAAAQTAYASVAASSGNTAELSGMVTWYR